MSTLESEVLSADIYLQRILAAIEALQPAQVPGAPTGLGGVGLVLSLPQIQLDVLRQGIASEQEGYGEPSIASLVITAPAGGTSSYSNTVGSNEVWVLMAPLDVASTVHSSDLEITATLDVPTKLLIPPYPFLFDRSFPSTTLRAVKKSLGLEIINSTAASAQVNFVTEYAVVPGDYFVDTVLRILELGNRAYQAVAAAAHTQGLVT